MKITQKEIEWEINRRKYNRLEKMFPDDGPFARKGYVKHLEFFEEGKSYRQRLMMAANRVGKTEAGAYEVALHLTGLYPDWWVGKRFDKPVNALVSGETAKLVRDSIQIKLMGEHSERGSGMIPKDLFVKLSPKHGISDALDTVTIKHPKGASTLQFQSYDQGREAFQATNRDIVWFDEEPPLTIYAEGLTRTVTTKGIVITTFTPLKGMSETVLHLQRGAEAGDVKMINATWDDAPHLSQEDKDELLKAYPPHMRDARTKGIPSLGSGAVYPVSEESVFIDPFPIPPHFRKTYAMDVGWNNTAAAWLAYDADFDVIYINHEYKAGNVEPAVHASAIRQRGDFTGVVDPASRGRSQTDGEQLFQIYRDLGLKLALADNGVESGIFEVYERLTTGRLKFFNTCVKLREEFRLYRRDERGRIVKENDHLMDCVRYAVVSGLGYAKTSQSSSKTINSRIPASRSAF